MFNTDSLVFDNCRFQDGFLSTETAARLLDKSPNALRIMVCRGRLKAFKDGQRLKFRYRDIKDALSKKGAF